MQVFKISYWACYPVPKTDLCLYKGWAFGGKECSRFSPMRDILFLPLRITLNYIYGKQRKLNIGFYNSKNKSINMSRMMENID